jgi:hypothetical protein
LVAAVWLEVIESAHGFDPRRGYALPWIFRVAAKALDAAMVLAANIANPSLHETLGEPRLLSADRRPACLLGCLRSRAL